MLMTSDSRGAAILQCHQYLSNNQVEHLNSQHNIRQLSIEDNKDSYDYASTSLIILEPILSNYEPPLCLIPSNEIQGDAIIQDNQSLRSSSEKSFSEYQIDKSLHMVKPVQGIVDLEIETYESEESIVQVLNLSALSEEYKKEIDDESLFQAPRKGTPNLVQSDTSIEMQPRKICTGHQKYTESLPSKKNSIRNSLIRSIRQPNVPNQPSDLSSSIFERNSFDLFKSKTLFALKAEANLKTLTSQLNHALTLKLRHHQNQPHQKSPQSLALEHWVTSQRQEIQSIQRHLMQGCSKLCDMIEYLMKEKSIIFDQSRGKIKANNRSFTMSNIRMPRSCVGLGKQNKANKSAIMPTIEEGEKSREKEKASSLEEIQEDGLVSEGDQRIVQEKIHIITTPDIQKKNQVPQSTSSPTESCHSLSSSCSSAPIQRTLKFSDFTENDEITLKIPTLQDSQISTPKKSIVGTNVDKSLEIPSNPNRIDTGSKDVKNYIELVFEWIMKDFNMQESIIDIVCQPFHKDSHMILAHMQNPEILYGPKGTEDYQLPNFDIPFQPPVLPVDLYLQIEKDKLGLMQSQDSTTSPPTNISFTVELQNIHNKAIFDGLNEALDNLRPYGLRGPPVPWSKQPRTLTYQYANVLQMKPLLNECREKVLKWQSSQAGPIKSSEKVKEERLSKILVQEVDEQQWNDFEMEETQIKLDLTDMIVKELCEEMIQVMNQLQTRKFDDNGNEL